MRAEHTICSFLYPLAEETSVVTDPQVTAYICVMFLPHVARYFRHITCYRLAAARWCKSSGTA